MMQHLYISMVQLPQWKHTVELDFKLCEGSPYVKFSVHLQKLCFTPKF